MKCRFILIALLAFSVACAQQEYEPQILILSPTRSAYDKIFENEIREFGDRLKTDSLESEKEMQSEDFRKQPPNIQRMLRSEFAYMKNLDFFKLISITSEQYLAYRFYERFTNLLVLLSDSVSDGQVPGLQRAAAQSGLQYVVNFPATVFYKEDGISYARIRVQLYDNISGSLLIDSSYTGDWSNPGFEFSCRDSTLGCSVNNALAGALDDVIGAIALRSPTLMRERALYEEREDVLINNYHLKSFDRSFITSVISPADSAISMASLYYGLVNDDKTKFVGFFLEHRPSQALGQLKDRADDKAVNIISNKNVRDSNYFDTPETYAYIVSGVRYKGKWYYEKRDVSYFEAEDAESGRLDFLNNLQDRNFFKEGTAEKNPDFWETGFFEKVRDLRKDPDWAEYGETIWKTEEEENRNYIGLYKIVANQLKKQAKR